jgi:hypothetical protein
MRFCAIYICSNIWCRRERQGTPSFWKLQEEGACLKPLRGIHILACDWASWLHSVCMTLLPPKGFSFWVAPRCGGQSVQFDQYHLYLWMMLDPVDYIIDPGDHLVRAFPGLLQISWCPWCSCFPWLVHVVWNEGDNASSFIFMSSLTHFLNPGHFPLKVLLLVVTLLVVSSEVTSISTLPAYGSYHLQLTADLTKVLGLMLNYCYDALQLSV